jgi:hypothetical protein
MQQSPRRSPRRSPPETQAQQTQAPVGLIDLIIGFIKTIPEQNKYTSNTRRVAGTKELYDKLQMLTDRIQANPASSEVLDSVYSDFLKLKEIYKGDDDVPNCSSYSVALKAPCGKYQAALTMDLVRYGDEMKKMLKQIRPIDQQLALRRLDDVARNVGIYEDYAFTPEGVSGSRLPGILQAKSGRRIRPRPF